MHKKIYFLTLGCSKNQVDSEKMSYSLQEVGNTIIDSPEDADIIILNTCAFIQEAKEESIQYIFDMAKYKKNGNCKKLIVAGCLSQRYAQNIKEEIPEVDSVFGVGDISLITDVINQETILTPSFSSNTLIKRNIEGYPGIAYLKISDGCSNHCSYCSIPLIRGERHSRPIEDILEEVNFLNEKKIKEIVIIAQDSALYGVDIYGKNKLVDLLKNISDIIDDDSYIRILYMNPDHIDVDMIKSLSKIKKFMPYFDIPFQSGSEKILKLMNRKGTPSKYLDLIKTIRDNFADVVIRTTFITGFPHEGEKEFNETLKFIEELQPDWCGVFTYSLEDGTKAAEFDLQNTEATKNNRKEIILDLVEKITEKRMGRFIGTKQKILLEEQVGDEPLYIGRFWAQAPEVDGCTVLSTASFDRIYLTHHIGNFIDVTIKQQNGKDLLAIPRQ